MESFSTIAANTPSIVLHYAAAFFFVVVALAIAFALIRVGRTLGSVEKLVADVDTNISPLLGKAGTTLDEVNSELSRVGEITAAVVDMTEKVDAMASSVERAITTPAKKAAAFGAGVSQAVSSFMRRGAKDVPESDAPAWEPSAATTDVPSTGGWAAERAAEPADTSEAAAPSGDQAPAEPTEPASAATEPGAGDEAAAEAASPDIDWDDAVSTKPPEDREGGSSS